MTGALLVALTAQAWAAEPQVSARYSDWPGLHGRLDQAPWSEAEATVDRSFELERQALNDPEADWATLQASRTAGPWQVRTQWQLFEQAVDRGEPYLALDALEELDRLGVPDLEQARSTGPTPLVRPESACCLVGGHARAAAVCLRSRPGVVDPGRAHALLGPSLDVALLRLGLDYADVLLLGNWTAPPPRSIVDAALELKAAGKARHLMISSHNRRSFESHIDDPTYDAIMLRYNAAHVGAEQDVFPLLPERGPEAERPGVVAYTATRWGTLLDRALIPKGEPVPRASDCYRFALSHPDVDVALCAPRNRGELDEGLAALDRGPLSDDETAWMRRVGRHVYENAKRKPRLTVEWIDRWMGAGK